jgi:hypothetical protein
LNRILLSRILFSCLLSNPIYYLFLLNYWLPFLSIPFILGCFFISNTRSSTNKNNTRLVALFNLYKAQNKNIGISANKALNGQISKLPLWMRGYLIMFRFDQMKYNMWCKSILSLNKIKFTFSLQNHLPQALLEHFKTQFLFLIPQKEQA